MTNNGRKSWFHSDERPFYFSEIKKDFCNSLFQENKTAFQKIESWFHFSKSKSSKKQTALSLIRSRKSANQYQRKRKIFFSFTLSNRNYYISLWKIYLFQKQDMKTAIFIIGKNNFIWAGCLLFFSCANIGKINPNKSEITWNRNLQI